MVLYRLDVLSVTQPTVSINALTEFSETYDYIRINGIKEKKLYKVHSSTSQLPTIICEWKPSSVTVTGFSLDSLR